MDDGWQAVPKEWLEPASKKKGRAPAKKAPAKKAPAKGDESSELSELSDSGDEKEDIEMDEAQEEQEEGAEQEEQEDEVDVPLPEGFVEWETVSVAQNPPSKLSSVVP